MQNIVLIGMPASGKSRIARELSEELKLDYIDNDEKIVKQENKTITEIFEQNGEDYFRKIESKIFKNTINSNSHSIVSIGGGLITNEYTKEENIQVLQKSRLNGTFCIYLDTCYEAIKNRISSQEKLIKRPIFLKNGPDYWKQLKNERHYYYMKCADLRIKIGFSDSRIIESHEVVKIIKKALESKRIHIQTNEPKYTVTIGKNLRSEIISKITNVQPNIQPKCLIIHTNPVINYANSIENVLLKNEYECLKYEIKDAENGKTISEYEKCLEFLANNHFTRTDFIIAVGGGALTDVAGFIAATYLRGIKYINVPTSLLAMVDASTGGKTAINLKNGKNLCGAFYEPTAVYCDISYLRSLSKRHIFEGLGEVAKIALTLDDELKLLLMNSNVFSEIEDLSCEFLMQIIYHSVARKAEIVSNDLRDNGNREFLNYGHTFAHAIEKIENYTILHGEAVSIGMVFAANLALDLNIIHEVQHRETIEILKKCNLPTHYTPSKYVLDISKCVDDIYNLMLIDKKSRGNNLRFVLLNSENKPEIVTNPPKSSIIAAIEKTIQI